MNENGIIQMTHNIRIKRGKQKGKFGKLKNVIATENRIASITASKAARSTNHDASTSRLPEFLKNRRFIKLDTFTNQLWCNICNLPLSLKTCIGEKKMGLGTIFTVECTQCNKKHFVHTDVLDKSGRTYEVNGKLAFGIIDAGMGESQLNSLFSSIDVPAIPSSTLKRYERKVGPAIESIAEESCIQSVRLEKELEMKNLQEQSQLRTRNEVLELQAETLYEKLQKLEENKADLTSHLQRILDKKIQEAQELNESLKALENLRKEEQGVFKKKEETMQHEYQTMENNLTAEIKLAAGKLNALEDFRLARIDLMKKFEEQEILMAQQAIHHKETLYETEKNFIKGKTKMQNELEKRLNELAERFRNAADLRLADATQRSVRENIALYQELNSLLRHCQELVEKMQEYKEREHSMRLQASLYEAEANLALKKVVSQNRMIDHLATEHRRMSWAIVRADRAKEFVQQSEKSLDEAKKSRDELEARVKMLEQHVQISRETRDGTLKEARDNCHEIDRLGGLLAKAKDSIELALRMQDELDNEKEEEEEEKACSFCFLDVKEKLIHSLLNILENYQSNVEEEKSTEQEPVPVENLYEFGNLGLISALPDTRRSDVSKLDIPNDEIRSSYAEEAISTISERTLTNTDCSCD